MQRRFLNKINCAINVQLITHSHFYSWNPCFDLSVIYAYMVGLRCISGTYPILKAIEFDKVHEHQVIWCTFGL